MKIDGINVAADIGLTVYEVARRAGVSIPVLCHRAELHPTGGCGVCAVEDTVTGRVLPACATRADESLSIATASAAALDARRSALELLLSVHPADCEAPCQLACPSGLPVPVLLERVAERRWEEAADLARHFPAACAGPAPCEKACRRRPLGGAVAICALHRWLAREAGSEKGQGGGAARARVRFRSRMAGLPDAVLLTLCAETGARRLSEDAGEVTHEAAVYEARRCLACGCRKASACRLRERCEEAGARQALMIDQACAVRRERGPGGFCFDASRCVLCGICVRTAARHHGAGVGPSFFGRGYDAQIRPPLGRSWDDVPADVLAACAGACPTGAMAVRDLATARADVCERPPD